MTVEIPNSSFADLDSYRAPAGGSIINTSAYSGTINVELVLERANDATALLNADWGSRQQQIAALGSSLWSTYGASQTDYQNAVDAIQGLGITVLDSGAYISGAETRTIWVQLNQDPTNNIDQFKTLFGTELLKGETDLGALGKPETLYWNGGLTLPWATDMGIKGIWFDSDVVAPVLPDPGSGTAVDLSTGAQSTGNALSQPDRPVTVAYPKDISFSFYNFPLSGSKWWQVAQTGTVGLLEPGLGIATPAGGETYQQYVDAYRASEGITGSVQVTEVAGGGTTYASSGERSLDTSVATSINPNSSLVLYAGSGNQDGATSSPLTAYQSAVWDTVNNPQVISSSVRFAVAQPSPGSPFSYAADQVFEDAALRNITVVSSSGDGGSSYETPNGLPNVSSSRGSPYNLLVGGTSVSTWGGAKADNTVDYLRQLLRDRDATTMWQLIASGLQPNSGSLNRFVETVWNTYWVEAAGGGFDVNGYTGNNASTGGVDPTHDVPGYQRDFGLTPTSSDPAHIVGRGIPDVSALAGGNAKYRVMGGDLTGLVKDGGTSAATPLWASLITQFNTIFADQKLPQLGYMNDLLYIAAAISPAAFHDVTIGNNISSFLLASADSDYTSDGVPITPTGFGYYAGLGYDLATGLGSPDGVLLGRALTAIAHHQMSYAGNPGVIASDGNGGWVSGASQTLIVQAGTPAAADIDVVTGGSSTTFTTSAAAAFAWTSRFAEQTVQEAFPTSWVKRFDHQELGMVSEISVSAGDGLAVDIDQEHAVAYQAFLTSPFGFADFANDNGGVRLARAVMVAETVEPTGNHAIVRMRDSGDDSLSLMFYKVDDFNGTVAGLAPGDAGYAAKAAERAYQFSGGGTTVDDPGRGQYGEAELVNVNAGDLIAMRLVDNTTGYTYWEFNDENAPVKRRPTVTHVANYGLNTYGWEESRRGGDRDYNDLVVQVDFTSAYGAGYLK